MHALGRGRLGPCGATPARSEEILAARQDLRSIDQVLADLPKRTRHIFILNRVHGGIWSEIASVMGVSRRTAAADMARAITACSDIRTD